MRNVLVTKDPPVHTLSLQQALLEKKKKKKVSSKFRCKIQAFLKNAADLQDTGCISNLKNSGLHYLSGVHESSTRDFSL